MADLPLITTGKDRIVALVDRVFPEPMAAKVPEITLLFWVIKILTTAAGEATSDYFSLHSHVVGGAIEVSLMLVALWFQYRTRAYAAAAYWFLALAIAIFGTGVSDTMHLTFGISYAGTTTIWAVALAAIFWLWHRSEGTLSIHSILTRRRETFYWATVVATFALGTALGDLTATTLKLGYLASGILFAVVIMIPAVAWRFFGLYEVAAFWAAYVVTRPLGASFADYFSKPHKVSGLDFGDGPTAVVLTVAVIVLVAYVAIVRNDIQPAGSAVGPPERHGSRP